MDFFYVTIYVNGFTPGLQNLYATLELHPWERLNLSLGYHYYAIATDLANMDRTLGHDFEFSADFSISKEVVLAAGFSYMIGGETMDKLKRSTNDSQLTWAWIDLQFRN
jgi:hypothetical protein